jgi:hypothetical protein
MHRYAHELGQEMERGLRDIDLTMGRYTGTRVGANTSGMLPSNLTKTTYSRVQSATLQPQEFKVVIRKNN